MRQLSIPACYRPTTALFVDDNQNYLNLIKGDLDLSKFSAKMLYDPMAAIELLRKYKPNFFTKHCISRPEESQFDHRNIDIDIRKIWQEIYNPDRFTEISVLVVDYAMPGLNGLDFAREARLIKNSNFKILMLTGEADSEIAVQAFNDKIIDKFIRKDSLDFEKALNSSIGELQEQYFYDLSQIVIDSLTKDPAHSIITWLDEPKFFKLFHDILQKHNLTEYYLADAFGSFIFLDFEGKPSWLVVKSEDEMRAAYEVADLADDPVPEDMLQSMKNREVVLYLQERSGLSDNANELKKSLHPATKLVGNKSTYYYSYVDNPNAYNIDSSKVLSYKAYREKLFSK